MRCPWKGPRSVYVLKSMEQEWLNRYPQLNRDKNAVCFNKIGLFNLNVPFTSITTMLLAQICSWWTFETELLKSEFPKIQEMLLFSKTSQVCTRSSLDTKAPRPNSNPGTSTPVVSTWVESPHAGTGKFLSNISIMRGWWPFEAASYPKSESHWVRESEFIDSSVLPPS